LGWVQRRFRRISEHWREILRAIRADAYTYAECDTSSSAYAHANSCSNPYSHFDPNAYAYTNAATNPESKSDADTHCNSDTYADPANCLTL
jgi:hypothetical protein